MTTREALFACTLSASGDPPFRELVRAWSAGEAAQQFGERLREAEVALPGTIVVSDLGGRVVRRAAYVRD